MEDRKLYNPDQSAEIESTDLYRRAELLSDEIWKTVRKWDMYCIKTIGEQLAKSMDSFSANLVEGDGRSHEKDAIRFLMISRGSAREARHWIRRAIARELVTVDVGKRWLSEINELIKMLQGLVRYRLKRSELVREVLLEDCEFGSVPLTL